MIPFRISAALLAMMMGVGTQDLRAESEINTLEGRLDQIDEQLHELANFSMQTSVGAIGFRSRTHDSEHNTEWVHLDLGEQREIDLVVLVPAIWREAGAGFIADGFPLSFEILAGSEADPKGKSIAKFTAEDDLTPRIAPLAIPCPGTQASWIKLVATQLTPRAWDAAFVLQLSEIMIFSGEENLALRREVTTSSDDLEPGFGARRKAFLTDGSLPYLMNAGTGTPSQAYILESPDNTVVSFAADIGKPTPVNRLHFHTLEVADTVPQANRSDFGVPHRFVLEGANQADFSDAVPLCSYHRESIYDIAPIIQISFPEHTCRHLRLKVQESDHALPSEYYSETDLIGIAEIEVFSNATNVLLNRPMVPDFVPDKTDRPLADLTDGRNIFGNILSIRSWVTQLALRHDLETERPRVVDQIGQLYTTQREHLELLKVLSIVLASGILILILVSHIHKMRTVEQLQRRFAADLHDEIGANLHAVGLLSDIAAEQTASQSADPELTETVTEIRAVTDRTADAVRYLANSQNPRKPIGTLEEDMHRIAARMMDDTSYRISVSGKEHIARLRPRQRADLFLFYKECLVNISRHSNATHFTAEVVAGPGQLTMTIEDNGRGIEQDTPPQSLQRRARILRAKLQVVPPGTANESGTRIILELPFRKLPLIP